jgi:hypothetical protein
MIVAQLRGIEFVIGEEGYPVPVLPLRDAAEVLEDVAAGLGFEDVTEYLDELGDSGEKLRERFKV